GGWSLNPDGSGTIFGEDDVTLKAETICPDVANGNQSVTLYAVWLPLYTNTFQFNANGGNGAMGIISAKAGEEITLLPNSFVRDGFRFVGWNVKRENDNTWYVAGKGWLSESEINDNSYSKKLYSEEVSLELDYSWFKDFEAEEAFNYTFYAVWKDATIESIALSQIEQKDVYFVNDQIDTKKLVLTVKKSDGTYEKITSGFTCEPELLTEEGTQTVTVTYKDHQTTFTVQVATNKTTDITATAKENNTCYYLPDLNATSFSPAAYSGDRCIILCQEGDFYLGFFPYGASSATKANGF
ncbi:MAG: InlB B-repeat-containing protein, partial [Clostridia bacterium]|nr:InlB B-repeat-containing protein [Clostridia bacterium]